MVLPVLELGVLSGRGSRGSRSVKMTRFRTGRTSLLLHSLC